MISLQRFRRWSFAPLAAWLLMQWAMALALPAQATASQVLGEDLFPSIVICTARGQETLSLAGGADGEGAPLKGFIAAGCDWCQAFGSGKALVPSQGFVLGLPARSATAPRSGTSRPGTTDLAAGFRSRAPPL